MKYLLLLSLLIRTAFGGSEDPDALQFISGAAADPFVSDAKKQAMHEFADGLKQSGLWNHLAFYGFRAGMGAGYPFGPAGFPTSLYPGNRNNARWTVTGAGYGIDGTTLTYMVGGPQSQYIEASYAPFAAGHNPMFGSITKVTGNPFSLTTGKPGYFVYGNDAMTMIQSPAGLPLQTSTVYPPVPEWGGRNTYYSGWSIQGTAAPSYNYQANTGWGGFDIPVTKPTLCLNYRNVGSNFVHAATNGDVTINRPTLYPQESFQGYAGNIRFTAPVLAENSSGITYGATFFYGSSPEIAALDLEEFYPLLATTYLNDLVDYTVGLWSGQSNAPIETSGAALTAPGGVIDLPTVVVRKVNANYGGNPISKWLISSSSGDRRTDSDTAYGSPTNGLFFVTSSTAYADILPKLPRTLARTNKFLAWNQGESDTELRLEAQRYCGNLTELIRRYRVAHGADLRVIYHLVDYGPTYRTYSGVGVLKLAGLTGAASKANGTYQIAPASGTDDYDVAYVWTNGNLSVKKNGSGQWEIKDGTMVLATSTGDLRAHPELCEGWAFAVGGGTPVFEESRLGNIETVRQAIRDVCSADPLGYLIDTRHYPRTNPNDLVHWYGVSGALAAYAVDMKAVFQKPGFLKKKVDHFTWSYLPNEVFAGSAFPVRLTARDAGGALVTEFNGEVMLSGSTAIVSPATVTLTHGEFVGYVSIGRAANAITLTASDGTGHGGISTPFRVAAAQVSTAGDSIPDSWKITNGFSAGDNLASLDTDKDGMDNLAEYLAGTDPRSSASKLGVESLTFPEPGKVVITWQGVAGKLYRLETSSDLSSWTALGSGILAETTGTQTTLLDNDHMAKLFVRIGIAPLP